MDSIEKTLRDLELSDKQILVYTSLLDMGRGSAHHIAKKTALKRTTAYSVLDELQELGLVHIIQDSPHNQYRPLSLEFLVEKKRRILKHAENIVPEVEARLKKIGVETKPHVQFYSGVDGIKKIQDYKLEEMNGKTIYAFYATAGDEVQKKFNYFKEGARKLEKLNIKARGIAPDDPENLERYREADERTGREVRILPLDIYSSNISIEIGDTWIKTNDFNNLQGLIIENPSFAKTMREIFEIVWKHTAPKDTDASSVA